VSTHICPQLSRHHPTEAAEKIGSVQQLGLCFVDQSSLAVVIPGIDIINFFVSSLVTMLQNKLECLFHASFFRFVYFVGEATAFPSEASYLKMSN
jgi:hypothetical protein